MPIDYSNLKEDYGFACAGCGYEQRAKPSMMMKCFKENSGCGSCLECKTFLHLEIDESGEKMISMAWDNYVRNLPKNNAEGNYAG